MKFLTGLTTTLNNASDSIITIIGWIVVGVIQTIEFVCELGYKIPVVGRWIGPLIAKNPLNKFCHLVDGHVLDAAISLTLGLLADLVWDFVSARFYWAEKDKSKAQIVPAPGSLNWGVAIIFFVLLTIRRVGWAAFAEYLYWTPWWQVLLTIVGIVAGITGLVVGGRFVVRAISSWLSSRRSAATGTGTDTD